MPNFTVCRRPPTRTRAEYFFLSVTAGVGLISEAAPMAEEIGGVGALAARRDHRVAVRGDALGRFWWPWWSDIAGRPWVLTAKFVFQRLIARAGAVALAREDARLPRRITDTRNELVHSA